MKEEKVLNATNRYEMFQFRCVDLDGNIIENIGSLEFFTSGLIIANGEIPLMHLLRPTGMTDKNGTNIYEGDIVEREINIGFPDYKIEKWVVYYGSWCWMRKPLDNVNGFALDYPDARTNCVVIGSIHQPKTP